MAEMKSIEVTPEVVSEVIEVLASWDRQFESPTEIVTWILAAADRGKQRHQQSKLVPDIDSKFSQPYP